MLQINSGKLFTREPKHRNELRGILYTNLRIARDQPIETVAGKLLPTSTLRDSNAVVYEVVEQIEAREHGPDILISHGIDPYISEFAAVTSFALNVICTPDPDLALRLTSRRPGLGVHAPPRSLVRRVFDEQVWCQPSDVEHLVQFVRDLIALERNSYLGAIRAIRTYVTGLHRLADDLELAYTLLVASIESLAQGFDGHRSVWADFDEQKRKTIDSALAQADPETGERVRAALLEIEHVSLARRFRDFTLAHLQPSYFRDETSSEDVPVGRAELPNALQQGYRLRSKYIHNLSELPRILALGHTFNETQQIDRVTVLTFQGLTRLARHVIMEFVKRQPKVEAEQYNYHLEQPRIVQMPMAPEYWVGRTEGLTPQWGPSRLEGFLEQLTPCLQRIPNSTITDLRDILSEVEKMIPSMKIGDRQPFLVLYIMFNVKCLPLNDRMSKFEKFCKHYGPELETPSVEAMLFHLVLDNVLDWELPRHEEILRSYFCRRDRKNGLRVPRILEAGLILVLAERYRSAGNVDRARELISFLVENFPGYTPLRDLEEVFEETQPIHWRDVLLPPSRVND